MKFGFRTPSLKKSFKARTTGKLKRSVKSSVNPLYGKKGMGLINNPKKALYNKVYNKTTTSIFNLDKKSYNNTNDSTNYTEVHSTSSSTSKGTWKIVLGIFFIFCGIFSIIYGLNDNSAISILVIASGGYLIWSKQNKNKQSQEDDNKENHYTEEEPMYEQPTINTHEILSFEESIPAEVFNLLWFLDGPYKNFENKDEYVGTIKSQYGEFNLYISMGRFSLEPSAISVKSTLSAVDDYRELSYFPSYEMLSPSQKYKYLTWLKDIRQPIDIGYVFIFYYGLERHLLIEDYENALKMIIYLQSLFDNKSFLKYSNNAVILATILHKNDSYLKYIDFETLDPRLLAILKTVYNLPVYPEDIIKCCTYVGWTNKRYIKQYPDLFLATMKSVMLDILKNPHYIIPVSFFKNITLSHRVYLANFSLSDKDSGLDLPNILSHEIIQKDFFSILSTTHETVKVSLRESRKTKSVVPVSDDDEIIID